MSASASGSWSRRWSAVGRRSWPGDRHPRPPERRTADATSDPSALDERFDAVIDIGGSRSLGALRRLLTRDGRLVLTGGDTGTRWLGGTDRIVRALALSPFVGPTLTAFVAPERAEDMAEVAALVASGAVTPAVRRTFALADAASAVAHLAAGRARGTVVVAPT